jgi:hypothetical protein
MGKGSRRANAMELRFCLGDALLKSAMQVWKNILGKPGGTTVDFFGKGGEFR